MKTDTLSEGQAHREQAKMNEEEKEGKREGEEGNWGMGLVGFSFFFLFYNI